MPRSKDLIGIHSGRPESPEVELLVQEAIGEALVVLLTEKGLYQKIDVSMDAVANYLPSVSESDPVAIRAKFCKRPWVPVSPITSSENQLRAKLFCGVSDVPLSTPTDEMRLDFPLPSIKLLCTRCGDEHTFLSITVMWWDGLNGCYPKLGVKTEQLFSLTYDCQGCGNNPICFLIKRKGLQLLLCGRSERLRVDVPRSIPRGLQDIIRDAIGAANENDLPAGFYHLRTFCEHYMKQCLRISVDDRIVGEDLGAQYNASIDSRLNSGIPSLPSLYEKLSKYMHTRTGTMGDHSAALEAIDAHLVAKGLFSKYGSK